MQIFARLFEMHNVDVFNGDFLRSRHLSHNGECVMIYFDRENLVTYFIFVLKDE